MAPERSRTLTSSKMQMEQGAARRKQTPSRVRTLSGYKDEDLSVQTGSRQKKRLLLGDDGTKNRLVERPLEPIVLPETELQLREMTAAKLSAPEDCDESESTSSEFRAGREGEKRRCLRSRPRRGLQQLVDFHLKKGTTSHSLLEEAAVTPRVRQAYAKRLNELHLFVKEAKLAFDTDEQIDQALVNFFNAKFKEGEGSSVGDYTLAALMDRVPQFGRLGHRKVPRAWRCLQGWRKLCPARSRLAYPLAVWCGWRMVAHGHAAKALFNLLQVSTYHRPGALLKLRKMGLVRPTQGVTGHWSVDTSLAETTDVSKTGTKDDSVLIDSPWLLFASPLLEELVKGDKMDYVFNFDYSSYLKVFRQACEDLKLQLVPYQARHSGPSIDRAKNARTQEEVRKRGNWASRQSVARESRQAGSHLAEAGLGHPARMQIRRALHRGDFARPRLSGDPSPWPVRKGAYFGDFFAGSGRIGRAANALGNQTRSWELDQGCNYDLTDRRVLSKIKCDIKRRLLLGGMFAPPCTTFSSARDRAGVIRTAEFPWGLPGL